MPSFQLHPGFAGQNIRCNPWKPTQFLISSSQHFGIVGSGKVYLVQTSPGFSDGSPVPLLGCFGTSDGAFDACFSEMDNDVVAVACGDGVKLYRLSQVANQNGAMPMLHSTEHQAEVSCVVWNSAKRDSFFSASWDRTIKMYSAASPQQSVLTLAEHMKEVYEVAVTARSPTSILSCAGDGMWKLWDLRNPQRSVMSQMGHQNQIILSIDFNKHEPNLFATGGVDRTVRVWDARRANQPLASLPGHDQACRRVRWAPQHRTMLASGGYDMRVCVWDVAQPQRPLLGRYQHHREFVLGLEWCPTVPNTLTSCSYDGTAFFLTVGKVPTPSPVATPLPAAAPPPRIPRPRPQRPGLPDPMPPMPVMPPRA
eukprot:gene850-486_t